MKFSQRNGNVKTGQSVIVRSVLMSVSDKAIDLKARLKP